MGLRTHQFRHPGGPFVGASYHSLSARADPGRDRPDCGPCGAWVLGDLADRSGLTRGLSEALVPLKQRRQGHDRGQVLTQLAVAIADGATTVSDIAVLRLPPDLFGRVASAPTVWRLLTALTGETLTRIAAARAGRDAATGIPAGAGCGRRGWTRTSM
jgi:hypothetical protein